MVKLQPILKFVCFTGFFIRPNLLVVTELVVSGAQCTAFVHARGESKTSNRGGAPSLIDNLLFSIIFTENCMKIIK